jgi:prepilin-type N-terminal cleavage/methylation domain-containing protein
MQSKGRQTGFSLVELVVVIVIIGILAAIAIPRLSRGASGASESALMANLTAIRGAITVYSAEHKNTFPGPAADDFVDQLTMYTDIDGNTNATKDAPNGFKYGPYLLSIPPCPVGQNAGADTAADVLIDAANSPPVPVPGGGEGWVYNPNTGEFFPNTDLADEAGKAYTDY